MIGVWVVLMLVGLWLVLGVIDLLFIEDTVQDDREQA